MRRLQQGFTLIELMVVVAVVGILAAVGLPSYKDYTMRSKWASNVADIEGLKKAIRVCMSENASMGPACGSVAQLQNHGFAGSTLPTPRYAASPVHIHGHPDGVTIGFWGSPEVGSFFYHAYCHTDASGNYVCLRWDPDNIPNKYLKHNTR